MDKWRRETFERLAKLGFSDDEAAQLVRASATLHTWAEHECNGAIQRDELTNVPYWYNTNTGRKIGRTSDRETGALKRAKRIANEHGLEIYHQGDPRGCCLWLYDRAKLANMNTLRDTVTIDSCYSTIGTAVVP